MSFPISTREIDVSRVPPLNGPSFYHGTMDHSPVYKRGNSGVWTGLRLKVPFVVPTIKFHKGIGE